ncbi:hypothetical protein CL91_gp73 [Mycobacterium phage Aeneas]|uniref:Uncharacterized protein n=3 Tax=Fromanvirus TaxID=186764 RepID=I3WX55_9CAUD|nr:hypothetical protein P756_gp70 [Mycobacterium phage PhrostyMug]YP_009016054.1 hypothetical protein CL67_gp68 [Mycobacterium phage Perseus]YP_009016338.1 hypothetical protein CL91_gp73 [Mycobacterium phage Aeneas]YP_009591815.1 hypothetical protein FDG62_gp075 [Mycobacterium phage Nepal]AGU92373.1 hypothetical protein SARGENTSHORTY9_73 [Mycobacterium phage SargentShorty9]ASZ74039.1 hypothetical protein SEA_SMAIRT_72 [Mycobacterium phage Smairt]QNL30950.1 hypothetical protein SEA_MULE_67 [My
MNLEKNIDAEIARLESLGEGSEELDVLRLARDQLHKTNISLQEAMQRLGIEKGLP